MSKKSEANAGQRRKPRAPTVSTEGIKQYKGAISDRELFVLNNRFEELERLRKEYVLNTPFIALEALGALAGGLVSGRSEADLVTTWPEEWGKETATVPLALLLALGCAWNDYKNAPPGKNLGEAFKIEGGRQGGHPMKSKLATFDRARKLARKVEVIYYRTEGEESRARLNDAIHRVASDNNLSFDTVKAAHSEHRDYIRSRLTDLGVLKGVKTSKG